MKDAMMIKTDPSFSENTLYQILWVRMLPLEKLAFVLLVIVPIDISQFY
jgi:hypothetical protein